MTENKDGTLLFNTEQVDDYYSQRNNKLVWPAKDVYPNSQVTVDWKSMCNVTSMVEALSIAGWQFPYGSYAQPEDNLAKYILENKQIDQDYMAGQPAMWKLYHKALKGECTATEAKQATPPVEIHAYLSKGTNLWLGSTATEFSTSTNFIKALWKNIVLDSLPIVISTNFGGFGHIVCCTGVILEKLDYEKGLQFIKDNPNYLPETSIKAIKVDDPWGNLDLRKNVYPAGGGGSGNNKIIPWDFVVEHAKPLGSRSCKWTHTFKHGMATI